MPVTETLSLDRLRRDGQAFSEEISREYYLAAAGLKPTAELQAIYAKYGMVMSEDALAMTLDAFRATTAVTEHYRQSRILLEWLASLQSSRELAPLEEREIAWEASAMVTLPDGSRLQYERAPIEIANAGDRAYRQQIHDARCTLVQAELAPLRQERLQRERDIIERLDLADGYNATWELLSGISLRDLRTQCEQFLRDTQAMWDETLPEFTKRVLGIDVDDATRADALALFRAREFDAYFPAREMEARVQKQTREMGIDPLAGAASGSIRRSAKGNGPARSARRCRCRKRSTSSCDHTAVRPTGAHSCTSSGMRCISPMRDRTIRSSTAGSATTPSPSRTPCCSTA